MNLLTAEQNLLKSPAKKIIFGEDAGLSLQNC